MAAIRWSAGLLRTITKVRFPSITAIRCPQNNLKGFSCTAGRRGLDEFFPPGVYESGGPGPKEIKTGRRWHASDLRQKSSNDLHKLWYVLLKEMNMLQTVKAEAKRLQVPMPNPERIKKVQKSMAMIKRVIGERELAVKKLEVLGYQSQFQEDAASFQEIDNKETGGLLKSSNKHENRESISNEQSTVNEDGKVRNVGITNGKSQFSMT
eukprot:gene13057-3833_t